MDVGYRDFKFKGGEVTSAPTEAKPESKLWYNDGFWWGILWNPDSLHYRIYRLDLGNQCWTDVGANVDDRPRSSADVLWDGTRLYVASRAKMNHKSAHGSQGARLFRFSYEATTKSYTLDDGFPVQINTRKSETLVLAKDSTGQLWATWSQSHKVMINRSLGDDLTWGKPFQIPVQQSSMLSDDICSVVAFGGDRIGVMWSHQPDQKIYFSIHKDNKSDTKWGPREVALADPELGAVADDHINLSVACTEDGTILATTKTSLQGINDPKIFLLKRTLSGEWTRYPFSFGDHKHTRPIVLFNSDTENIYVIARGLEHPFHIYYKQTHLANPFFPAGFGTLLISSQNDDDANDPTSTKQCITNESGLLVLASDSDTKRYLHNYLDLNGGVDNQSPVAADDQRTIFEDNAIAIDVLANDGDPDGTLDPASLTLITQPAHGAAQVNSLSAVVTYTPNADFSGSDIFTYRISDNRGAPSNEAIVTITVNEVNDPPVTAPDSAATDNTTAVILEVLSNDSDVDHNVAEMIPTITTFPANGTVSVNNGTGEVIYTPNINSFGTDTFTYSIHDPAGATSNAAQVSILVLARPVAVDDIAVTEDGVPVDIDILANDTDLDGALQAETISLATAPSNGSINIDSQTGVVTYTPEMGNFGTEVLTYTVLDDSGLLSNPATITIDIVGPPVAVNDSAITIAATPITIPVLDNDFDPDGGMLKPATLRTTVGPLNGVISINAINGAVTYTPDVGYSGTELIGYKVDDDEGNVSNEASIRIRVNLPPTAADDAATTFEDIPVAINVTANDSDPDGSLDRGTVTIHQMPSSGTLETNPVTGVVTYSPEVNTFGLDSFTYSVRDNDGTLSNSATVSLVVNSLNDAPVAVSDTVMTQEDTAVEIPILENDFDVDGSVEPASIVVQSQPEHGALVLNSLTGMVRYTPEADFFGSDLFRYTIHDAENALSQVASVLIIVLNDNDKPVAVNDSAVTNLGAPVDIAVATNDFDIDNAIDASTIAIATPPGNGLANAVGSNGLVRYLPNAGFSGFDRFQYTVRDEGGQLSNSATVVVRVIGPPVARDDTTFTGVGNSTNIAVLQNDFDPDGAGLDVGSVVKLLGPFNGSATVDPATGVLHYVPQINFDGIDAVRYTVKDLDGFTSNEATVTIFVGSNTPPVANDDAAVTNEDTPILVDLTANDTDSDGLVMAETVGIRSEPGHGRVTIHSAGVNYAPDENYFGQDAFTYVVRDNENASSNIATVSITVQAVNDPPIAQADSASTQEETAVTLPVTSNDRDIDGVISNASLLIVSPPRHGSATADPQSGDVVYVPEPHFGGVDTFEYTVADEQGLRSNAATVSVTVAGVNDAPVAVDDTVTTPEDTPLEVSVTENDLDAEGALDPSSVTITTAPGHGNATVAASRGVITYAPDADYFGADTLHYVVRDDKQAISNTATVSILVTAVNDPPTAADDQALTHADVAVEIDVLANDQDKDGSLLASSVVVVSPPNQGSTSVNPGSGKITYTPDSGFVGADSFRYTVRDDGNAVSNEATVTVTVNSSPGGGQFAFASIEDGQVKVTEGDKNYGAKGTAKVEQNKFVVYLKFRVTGLAGAVRQAVVRLWVTAGSHDGSDDGGSLFGVSNTYKDSTTPWDEDQLTARNAPPIVGVALASAGAVSPGSEVEFDVTGIVAGDGVFSFAVSSQSINQVKYFTKEGTHPPQLVVETSSGDSGNLPPVAVDDAAETLSGTPVEIDVLSNDTDSDGKVDVTTVAMVSLPAHGAVSISGSTGRITYTPADGFTGQDAFAYEVKDDAGASSAPATVTVTVKGGSTGGQVTFHSVEDGQIKLTAPGKNYGSKGTAKLEIDKFIFYLKFQVSGLQDGIRRALLRLHVGNNSGDGGDDGGSLFPVSNDFQGTTTPWQENNLTASNAPDLGTAPLGSAGPVSPGNLVEFDVTNVINGNGFYSFALANKSTNLIRYSTREGLQPPELLIETSTPGSSNLPPVAENDQAETDMDTPVAIEVLANDSDSDGTVEPATVAIGTPPVHGTVSLNMVTGDATYTPSTGFSGTDQFTYHVEDNRGAVSNDAVVAVTVNSAGTDGPVTYTPIEDGQVKVTEPGKNYGSKSTAKVVLGRFLFYLKFQVSGLTGDVAHAMLRLNTSAGSSDGGDDGGSLYSVSNTYLASTTPWQEEGLTAANAPAIDGSLLDRAGGVAPNTVVEFDVSAAIQGDGVYSFALASLSANQVKYFTKEGVSPPRLFIEVVAAGSNQRPIAVNDERTTPENIAAVIDVLFNDHDDDGHLDISSVTIVDEPTNGTLLVNPNSGVITYTPSTGFSGPDVFTYTVRDNDGDESNVATVTIDVIRPGGATTLTFKPSHDAQVKVSVPLKNYGSKTTLKVAQDRFKTYFKFTVSGISGTVTDARLRLHVSGGSSDGSKDGGTLYRVSNDFAGGSTPWVEGSLNAANAPEITGEPLSSAGPVSVNSTVEFDVSEAITANGTYSFVIKSTATDQVKYISKEGAISPELLVEFIATASRSEFEDLTLNSGEAGDGQAQAIGVPEEFELHPNYPNPFNAATTIEYAMPEEKRVELLIFNTRGQEVRRLVDAMQSPGHKKVIWNGRDNSGLEVGSGIYFLRLEVGNRIFTRKLALQK